MASKEYIGSARLTQVLNLIYGLLQDVIVEEFDSASDYYRGDPCFHGGKLYVCDAGHFTGAWDSNYWLEMNLVDFIVSQLQSIMSNVFDVMALIGDSYVTSNTYNKNDICLQLYNGKPTVFKCISDTPVTGTWDSSKWQAVDVSEVLTELLNTNLATEAENVTFDKTGTDIDADNVQDAIEEVENPAFTEAQARANISTGESLKILFGKIKKFFSDLKTVAFTGSYNDLSNKPTIPTDTNQLTNGAGFITSSGTAANVSGTVAIAHGGTGATTAAAARNALGLGNTTGALPIANGGTGATTRLNAVKNLTNEAVSSPGYVIGMTSSWGKFGYTTLAQLKSAMSLNNVNNTADANKTVALANGLLQRGISGDTRKLIMAPIDCSGATTGQITNFKTIFNAYRQPILCVFSAQQGTLYVFTIYTGSDTSWPSSLSVAELTGGHTLSVAWSGNNLVISGFHDSAWGQGWAIGFGA